MPRTRSPAAVHVGSLIKANRERRGWTQDQLAVASDIDSSNVRTYESGRSLPGVKSLLRIALALDVTPADLLNGVTLEMFPENANDKRRRGNQ